MACKLVIKLKHDRDTSAATMIQSNWRTFVDSACFQKTKAAAILIQSLIRMKLALVYRYMLVAKLEDAATYHVDDFFDFSKKRKASSIKIQTACRRFIAVVKYSSLLQLRGLAATKIQSTYRMYSTCCDYFVSRMVVNYAAARVQSIVRMYLGKKKFGPIFWEFAQERRLASTKIQAMYRMFITREAFIVKKYLHDHPVTIEDVTKSYGCSKKRQFAATRIQSSFRKHCARSNYLELFSLRGTPSDELDHNIVPYCTEVFFQDSKKRCQAASKIQNAYRKHLFRTTCFFRMISFDDDSNVESGVDCLSIVGNPNYGMLSIARTLFCSENLLDTFKAVMVETDAAETVNALAGFLGTEMFSNRS